MKIISIGKIVFFMMAVALLSACQSSKAYTGPVKLRANGVGVSGQSQVAKTKGAELYAQLKMQLGEQPEVMILFCRWEKEITRLAREIRVAAPSIDLIGCCHDISFFVDKGKAELNEVTLIGLTGEGVEFKTAVAKYANPKEMVIAGKELGQALKPASGRGVLLLLTDAVITHNGAYDIVPMYKALQGEIGKQVIVVGGNAAYGNRSILIHNDEVASLMHVGLMIDGPINYAMVMETGKEIISPEIKITKMQGKQEIVELDARPWIDVYRQYTEKIVGKKKFLKASSADRKPGAWSYLVGRRLPYGVLKERKQPLIRLAHGLAPWAAKKDMRLPCECYYLAERDTIVITQQKKNQLEDIGKCFKRLDNLLKSKKQNITMFFPCESNAFIMDRKNKQAYLQLLQKNCPENGSIWGFTPCGEHGTWYEPDKDSEVSEIRYHQLVYPMAELQVK